MIGNETNAFSFVLDVDKNEQNAATQRKHL